ncbi:hypothetical protein PR048_005141 [Dryococelus australis]|uniref:Uncharacterized protein n=1 Tax=Dryococelus australis TaxID=614101 RepID=A0ABQ9I7C6_9NEOP|nr:hypothetical protein PR048_005141 [Dryococelus australis]
MYFESGLSNVAENTQQLRPLTLFAYQSHYASKSGNIRDSYSEEHGFSSQSSHREFDFPWFAEFAPGECWDESLLQAVADTFCVSASLRSLSVAFIPQTQVNVLAGARIQDADMNSTDKLRQVNPHQKYRSKTWTQHSLVFSEGLKIAEAEVIGFNPRLGHSRIFACENLSGRCRWSAGSLGDQPFPPPFHSSAAQYSPHSPSFALKASMLRVAEITSLTHSIWVLSSNGSKDNRYLLATSHGFSFIERMDVSVSGEKRRKIDTLHPLLDERKAAHVEGTLDRFGYDTILGDYVHPCMMIVFPQEGGIFQHDVPCRTARSFRTQLLYWSTRISRKAVVGRRGARGWWRCELKLGAPQNINTVAGA